MKKRLLASLFALLAVTAVATVAAVAAHRGDEVVGFKTTRPAQLVPLENGVEIEPILSTGDIVGGMLGGFQFTGIPDGIGAYRSAPATGRSTRGTLEVFVNHELAGDAPAGVGSRVSHLTLNGRNQVVAAEYVIQGTEGFLRFCSSTLDFLDGVPWYFTGEESTSSGAPPTGGRGGSSIAINAQTGRWYETRHFGLFSHENLTPMQGLSGAMIVSAEDGPAGVNQVYAYTAETFAKAIRGEGQLWVWRATITAADGNPSSNDITKGQTIPGEFVPVTQEENSSAPALEAASQAKGAFDFVRLEDAAESLTEPGVLYFDDTGAAGGESVRGRVYRMQINPTDPTKASLSLLLDGDRGDDIVNPDNIDVSDTTMIIQEDRNSEHRSATVAGGYARVIVYDLRTGSLRPVARVSTPPPLRPGEWESSGVINAEELIGPDWWILDVQGHGSTAPQPNVTLEPNTGTGEDGQLLAIRIPATTR